MLTCQALQPISELSLEVVNNKAVVPRAIYVPFLSAGDGLREHFKLGFSLRRHSKWRRLLEHTVQILV